MYTCNLYTVTCSPLRQSYNIPNILSLCKSHSITSKRESVSKERLNDIIGIILNTITQ